MANIMAICLWATPHLRMVWSSFSKLRVPRKISLVSANCSMARSSATSPRQGSLSAAGAGITIRNVHIQLGATDCQPSRFCSGAKIHRASPPWPRTSGSLFFPFLSVRPDRGHLLPVGKSHQKKTPAAEVATVSAVPRAQRTTPTEERSSFCVRSAQKITRRNTPSSARIVAAISMSVS